MPSSIARSAVSCLAAACLAGCGILSFSRPVTNQELQLRGQVVAFYGDLQRAFAAGNADALAGLFSPSITRPMSYDQVRAWARKFFSENKTARFRIVKLEFEGIGPVQAIVVLTYRVETPDGKEDFGGTERDILKQSGGRWSISEWEKVSPGGR